MIFKNLFYLIETLLFKFILEFPPLRTTEEHKADFSVTNMYTAVISQRPENETVRVTLE